MLSSLLPLCTDPSPWLAVFGRAHPVLLHAPLGILPAIAVLEFGALLLRRSAHGAVRTLAWLTALSAAAAAASGLVLADEEASAGQLISQHQLFGLVFAGLCVLAAVLSLLRARLPFRLVLLAALGAMVPTGHFGGSITHGQDFLFAPLRERPLQPVLPNASAKEAGPTEASPTEASTEFQRTIVPILERTCTKCHNEDKQKGELLMTTAAGLQQGGENGVVVVPSKPDDSPLLLRCLLPIDHDDHMPPEGKPQPTPAEIETLRRWIANGAPY